MFGKLIAGAGAVALVGAVAAGSANAHHSYAMFDANTTLNVPATVVKWEWTNPHSFLMVVDNTNGGHWDLEAASPSMLSRNGLNRATFKPGDKVTVTLHPRRDNKEKTSGVGSLMRVTLADGKVVPFEAARPEGAGRGGPAPAPAS
ncbi:MAG TPA: DUF6152 family protein [Caulobacteraceae bacterium]|jgi:hypothetical protein|nr:DUF6152 family protein [Caulobacteraceae bacterium]